jgi:hypothetical protein
MAGHLAQSNSSKGRFSVCRYIEVALLLCLSAVLSAGAGSAGAESSGGGSGSGAHQVAVTLSLTSVNFGNQTTGTKSAGKVVTLANTGVAALSNISISVTSNFTETNNCGTSLNVGGKCVINVTFAPNATGAVTGRLTVSDSATGSPQTITLSGEAMSSTGGGGGVSGPPGTICSGTPITQVPTNVTSEMTSVNTAAGVTVTQLTDNGTNRFYYFDVPAYSPAANQIVYVNFVAANGIVTSNTDGTGAQIVSPTSTGSQAFLSQDGKLVYYIKPAQGGVPGGIDMFGMFLNTTGMCQEMRLSNLDVPPQAPLPVWEISGASSDPTGGYDIAFSPDTLVHRVHILTSGTSQALPNITLNDPESNATFHRLRMNPKFPNIVMYKRNQLTGTTAQPEVWLVDLNTCTNGVCSASQIINVVANVRTPPTEGPEGGHINWSPDGLDIAFSEPDIADYWLARNVVSSNGTVNTNFTLQELGPFKTTGRAAMTADYCAFPPTWPTATILACLAGPDSSFNPKSLYLMSSDGQGTTKILTGTDAQVLTIDGTPMPEFVQDGEHLMFNSDRTGVPQIYLVSGFTLTLP